MIQLNAYIFFHRELRDRMRPFAQFLNSGEHERLIASIERERELRHRLSELKRYRGLGLTTQEEIVHYEQHVAFQRQQIRQGKAVSFMQRIFAGRYLILISFSNVSCMNQIHHILTIIIHIY